MNVFLLKDVTNVGHNGEIVKVTEGFARNFLFPKKLAVVATDEHVKIQKTIQKKVEEEEIAQGARSSALADIIKRLSLVIKRKVNDKGKLYGAINAEDLVELLKEKNINVNKKQIEFDRAIRTAGEYIITIRLSSKLRPTMKVTIVAISGENVK